jgi:hypothetical protein
VKRRRKLSPAGNGPLAVLLWWLWNVIWFGACILATIYLARILIALLYFALVRGVGTPS